MATATFLFVLLFIAFAAFMIYSAILMYHWFKYAMSNMVAMAASVTYMILGFMLLFVMLTVTTSIM